MKALCLTIILALSCLVTRSQILYPRIGATASVNTYNPTPYDIKPRVGFLIGVGYQLKLTNTVSARAELNYVRNAYEAKYAVDIYIPDGMDTYELHESASNRYNVSYLEVPVLLKIKLLHKDFFVTGGPSVALGLGGSHRYNFSRTSSYLDPIQEAGSGKIKFDGGLASNKGDIHYDSQWDVGFQAGIGALLFKKLQVECRQSFGTINLYKNIDSKNRYLQVSFSIPIPLGD
ncbi:porin family protein [Chryseolinea sp. H1M3-3]|uniref:porin family protein n=1 Tax=Chryseolinea sp. H1M3-3 TaxID=3034144 RepID=UPI0023EBAC2A|nr:porin family protein [Chryseolinea sp. H1M3-3]